jgi:hypothetical protein
LEDNIAISRLSFNQFKGVFSDKDTAENMKSYKYIHQQSLLIRKELENSLIHIDTAKSRLKVLIDHFNRNKKNIVGSKCQSDVEYFLRLNEKGKVIFIVRDPRDTMISRRHHYIRGNIFFNGDEKFAILRFLNKFSKFRKAFRLFFSRSPYLSKLIKKKQDIDVISQQTQKKFLTEWVNYANYIKRFCDCYPESTICVRYEDLMINPDNEIVRIYNFLDVNFDPNELEELLSREFSSKTSPNSFIRSNKLYEWKNFSEELRPFVNRIIPEELLVYFKYELQ